MRERTDSGRKGKRACVGRGPEGEEMGVDGRGGERAKFTNLKKGEGKMERRKRTSNGSMREDIKNQRSVGYKTER